MAINTLDFNCKEGEEIPLDDVDEERYIQQYILTEEESRLKEMIWRSQNADYIKKQKEKRRTQKILEKHKRFKAGDKMSQPSQISEYTPCDNKSGAQSIYSLTEENEYEMKSQKTEKLSFKNRKKYNMFDSPVIKQESPTKR